MREMHRNWDRTGKSSSTGEIRNSKLEIRNKVKGSKGRKVNAISVWPRTAIAAGSERQKRNTNPHELDESSRMGRPEEEP